MSAARGPADDYLPEPELILFGCQPFVPGVPPEGCPICKGLIGTPRRKTPDSPPRIDPLDNRTYCARCDAMSPANERKATSARVRVKAVEADEAARQKLKEAQRKAETGVPILTESERRRYWFGCRKTPINSTNPRVTNLMDEGRQWLAELGQLPNFDLIIDRRGNIIGRKSEPPPDGPTAA